MLKMQSGGEKDLLNQLQEYAYLENDKTKALQSDKTRNKKKRIHLLIIIMGILLILYLILLILSNVGDETESQNIRQVVIELIQDGRYDEARVKAAEAEYSWEAQELNEMIDQAQNKQQ